MTGFTIDRGRTITTLNARSYVPGQRVRFVNGLGDKIEGIIMKVRGDALLVVDPDTGYKYNISSTTLELLNY